MRPGEQQPGGGQSPQWSTPQQPGQQPGYANTPSYPQQPPPPPGQQPTQPGFPTPSSPYAPHQTPPGQWQQPGQVAPPPSGGRGRGKAAVAIVVAAAVIAATAITVAFVMQGGDDDGTAQAGGGDTASPTDKPSDDGEDGGKDEGGSGGGGDDPNDPRQGVLERPDPVVAPDWQVQTIENRHNAFDVPPDWEIGSETYMVGFTDDREDSETFGEPLVAMSAVSTYREGWCDDADGTSFRAVAGTKGAQGATGTAEAAENEAVNWALAGYDQEQKGKLEVTGPKEFESDYGIVGHTATATITDVPEDPDNECGTYDGKVVTVSYLDSENDLATWVLVTDTGFKGELDDETIEKIMNSLRPYPAPEETS